MAEWNIDFISQRDFTAHVKNTIESFGDKIQAFDLKRLNKNIIDPVKLIFDKNMYGVSWRDIIDDEIARQRDKSNNNDIGYFHQRFFQYLDGCHVPNNGTENGWDVIYENPKGIQLPDGDVVHTIYVEMKNKHNTMNSSSAGKTYIKMQNQILHNDDCACFLVEAIAQRSQNITWGTTVDGAKVAHKKIRRVSLDQFYSTVTGEEDAFFQICLVLPDIIKEVVQIWNVGDIGKDTAYDELIQLAKEVSNGRSDDAAMTLAIYMLGFRTYEGFNKLTLD